MRRNLYGKHGGACAVAGVLLAMTNPASGHVVLDAPDGDDVLIEGTVSAIRWTLLIEHELLGWDLWYGFTARGPWTVIELGLPPGNDRRGSRHTYEWTVPDLLSTRVYVRVRMINVDGEYNDTNNLAFTVTRAGDLDADADLDLDDWATLSECSNGPGALTPPGGCAPADFANADLDGDGDVDLRDEVIFTKNFWFLRRIRGSVCAFS